MKLKFLLVLLAGFAFACSEKPAEKPAPAPKVAAAKPAESAAPATAAAPAAKAATKQNCPPACSVDVTVTESSGACTAVISDAQQHLAVAQANTPTNLIWQVKGAPGYRFSQTPGGIVFGGTGKDPPPPSSVMQNGAGGGATVTISDNHTSASSKGSWAYTANVESANGSIKCKADPSVDNE